MGAVANTRSQPPQVLRCEQCGDTIELSTRSAQRYRTEGREPRCTFCRRPRQSLSNEERERLKRWWLEKSGLSVLELHEIALGLTYSSI